MEYLEGIGGRQGMRLRRHKHVNVEPLVILCMTHVSTRHALRNVVVPYGSQPGPQDGATRRDTIEPSDGDQP